MTDRERISALVASQSVDRRGHRLLYALVAASVLLGLVLGTLFLVQRGRTADLQHDVGALQSQVIGLGATPVAGPAGVPGQPGATGQRGATGTSGVNGVDGTNGVTPPCLSGQTQCQGADGKDGVDGKDGAPGADGVNGVDGKDGKDGAAGKDGPQGPPGPACPDGYEQRTAVITAPDRSTYDGIACVQPETSTPPSIGGGLPLRIG